MRSSIERPGSQHGVQPHTHRPAGPTRKIFNCIVDDTALVAGVKKSTRNGIRQWVKNGQMRLFVPLHALEQLSRQKGAANRHGEDVRETLQWLDDATSKYPHAVTLQGGDQYYQDWSEVERFAVPRTLFSETDLIEDQDVSALSNDATAKLSVSDEAIKTPPSSAGSAGSELASPSSLRSNDSSLSAFSPPTSPAKIASTPARLPKESNIDTSCATVPSTLQPLFNYILWRIHQELDPVAALESFIFLCNDPRKVHFARGFDVRYKRLEQLREVISREDRDCRNRVQLSNRENNIQEQSRPASQDGDEEEDNEVVFKPPPRAPAAMLSKQYPNVIDPNSFGRSTTQLPSPRPSPVQPQSPRFNHAFPAAPRGGPQTLAFSPRGRGGFRGSPRARGGAVPSPARGGHNMNKRHSAEVVGGQIDPDSFARPRGSGYTGRGGRKLWVPT